MLTVIIIAIISMLLYIACGIFYFFFKPRIIFNLLLNYPIQTMIVTKLWWYGSLLTLIFCIAYHFIVKYW